MLLQKVIDKIFGSKNDRALKRINPRVADIGVHEERLHRLAFAKNDSGVTCQGQKPVHNIAALHPAGVGVVVTVRISL